RTGLCLRSQLGLDRGARSARAAAYPDRNAAGANRVPRPRHVVPPCVPRRRLAAVCYAQPHGGRRPWRRDRGILHTRRSARRFRDAGSPAPPDCPAAETLIAVATYSLRFASSSVSCGATVNRSPTTP